MMLEGRLIHRQLKQPDVLPAGAVADLRYILSFARLTQVRNVDGRDVDLTEMLSSHRTRIHNLIEPRLQQRGSWSALARILPNLTEETVAMRQRVLAWAPLNRDALEQEVTERQLVVACGGGGGSGYGYAGAFALMDRCGLQPAMLAGTSMGALACMFRARRRVFDAVPLIEATRRLRWNTVFEVLNTSNRYGVPATLRLYLRRAIGPLVQTEDGRPITFNDAEVPLLIVATGITMEGLKHDLSYYEHFLDDVVKPGMVFRLSRMARLQQYASLLSEFIATPDALREIVFGRDPQTMDADIVDAAGFSSAVPGLIHYDVLRDDPRMKRLLDGLYSEYGITRLGEGGLVCNVPARPAFEAVMDGQIVRRNPVVVAMDCFTPRMRSLIWYPIQQIAAMNVRQDKIYADLYVPLDKVLSPAFVVPTVRQLTQAMAWTTDEMTPHMPFIKAMCATHRVLRSPKQAAQAV